jgi:DNA-directed RNA polymerase specialized sigma24 family protein
MLEAIRRYRKDEHTRIAGCRFRSFLYRVLTARFIDALRQRGGRCRRLLLQGHMVLAQKVVGGQPGGSAAGAAPGQRLEGQELWGLVHTKLAQLGATAREMWTLLAQEVPLRSIAQTLNISYDAAKRRRRHLFAQLRATLGKEYHP